MSTRRLTLTVMFCAAALIGALIKAASAAVPSDTAPAAAYGSVNVPCYDGGSNAAAIPMSPANGNAILIQNLDSSNAIYCGPSASVTSSTGISVVASGGVLSVDVRLNATTGPKFYCIKDTCNGSTVQSQASGLTNTRYLNIK